MRIHLFAKEKSTAMITANQIHGDIRRGFSKLLFFFFCFIRGIIFIAFSNHRVFNEIFRLLGIDCGGMRCFDSRKCEHTSHSLRCRVRSIQMSKRLDGSVSGSIGDGIPIGPLHDAFCGRPTNDMHQHDISCDSTRWPIETIGFGFSQRSAVFHPLRTSFTFFIDRTIAVCLIKFFGQMNVTTFGYCMINSINNSF